MRYFVLRDKKPVRVEPGEWQRWFRTFSGIIREEWIDDLLVTTQFLGTQSRTGDPLFETLVRLDGKETTAHYLYHSWEQAEEGHNRTVFGIRQSRSEEEGSGDE